LEWSAAESIGKPEMRLTTVLSHADLGLRFAYYNLVKRHNMLRIYPEECVQRHERQGGD